MNSKKINILKIKYKYIYIYKNKIKFNILKSMFLNRNINSNNRVFSYLIINQKKIINNKTYSMCKFSGYTKNVNRFISLGRHELNREAILGKLQNIKINSW
uniref:Ribosomal protein S14 n=1 Tax=Ichthyophthirius multifiliis TaxID=5932 RepID=G1FLC0_ICHMU|nr:ribosomal protein S14 [Ichthyophthirius multifiliis]AEL89262.1 ribosomal protein S14 [Ichthyophthirius multifiliis]